MKARRVYWVAGTIGLVCAVVGLLQSYHLFRLISLEREGKCDFVPCADAGTYGWLGAFLVLTVIGVAVLSAFVVYQPKSDKGFGAHSRG